MWSEWAATVVWVSGWGAWGVWSEWAAALDFFWGGASGKPIVPAMVTLCGGSMACVEGVDNSA
eukprot:184160-Chlamydomonas_euryale.AAC.1